MAMRELSLDEVEWVSGGIQSSDTDISDGGGSASDGTTATLADTPPVQNPDGSTTVAALTITAPSASQANLQYDVNFLNNTFNNPEVLGDIGIVGTLTDVAMSAGKLTLVFLINYAKNYNLTQVNANATAYYSRAFGEANMYYNQP